jgi:hypothetical protein
MKAEVIAQAFIVTNIRQVNRPPFVKGTRGLFQLNQ